MEKSKREIGEMISLWVIMIALAFIALMPTVAFAADPIEVSYSGGSRIDDVARVNMFEVDHLFGINHKGPENAVFFGGPWTERSHPDVEKFGKSITVPRGAKVWDNTGFICENEIEVDGEYYDLKITVEKTVNNTDNHAYLWKQYNVTEVMMLHAEGTPSAAYNMPEGIFCSCKVEIFKHGSNEKLKLDRLMFCIDDFDCSQSFSSSNIDLSPSNLLIREKGKFPGVAPAAIGGIRGDAYVNSSGLYYSPWANAASAPAGKGADLFLDISGLEEYNMVFGFRSNAASGIHFYTTKNIVDYRSVNGEITGIETESVLSGRNPLGTSQVPNENYSFTGWKANVPVTLDSGEVISPGTIITMDQIKRAVITGDVVFTAYNDPVHSIETEVLNGKITPSEMGIPKGQNRTVTYTADKGYQLLAITVDGVEKERNQHPVSYTFSDIEQDHRIRVEYEKTPGLEIVKTAEKKVYNAGDRVVYTVTVKQTEDGAEARNITVRDTLPEGMVLEQESIDGDVNVINTTDDSYELKIDSLKEQLTYTYSAITDDDKDADELINTVTASADNIPGDPARDSEEIKALIPRPKLTKIVSNEKPKTGDVVTYTISALEPQEGVEVRNGRVSDLIPEGVEYIDGSLEVTGDRAEAEIDEGEIIAEIPALAGETVITFRAAVKTSAGSVENTARMKGDGIDELAASATFVVEEPPMVAAAEDDEDVDEDQKANVSGGRVDPIPDAPAAPAEAPDEVSSHPADIPDEETEKPAGKTGSSPGTGDGSMIYAAIFISLLAGIFILLILMVYNVYSFHWQ